VRLHWSPLSSSSGCVDFVYERRQSTDFDLCEVSFGFHASWEQNYRGSVYDEFALAMWVVNIWNCLPSNTVDWFCLHSLRLSALLNVSISEISLTLRRFLRVGIVSFTFVFLMFILFYFILFYFILSYFYFF